MAVTLIGKHELESFLPKEWQKMAKNGTLQTKKIAKHIFGQSNFQFNREHEAERCELPLFAVKPLKV